VERLINNKEQKRIPDANVQEKKEYIIKVVRII
jgi:hypothetical protein